MTRLSLLWATVALNMIGADVLSQHIPGMGDELLKTAGGNPQNIRWLMLGGAAIYAIPISMMLLSRVLPPRSNRWVQVVAAVLSSASLVAGATLQPHYLLLSSLEVLAMGVITWTALRWDPERPHQVGVEGDPRNGSFGVQYSYRF